MRWNDLQKGLSSREVPTATTAGGCVAGELRSNPLSWLDHAGALLRERRATGGFAQKQLPVPQNNKNPTERDGRTLKA